MKKVATIVVALVVSLAIVTTRVSADGFHELMLTEEKQLTSSYIQGMGTITNIHQNLDKLNVTIEGENDQIAIIVLDEHAILFHESTTEQLSVDTLKEGDRIAVYYDRYRPMILIYPPQIYPDFIILKDSTGQGLVKVSKFNEQWMSLDQQLKINLSENTLLLNAAGERISQKQLKGKDLLVFYTFTTKSLPPQTTPTKVVAFDNESENQIQAQKIMEADHYLKDGVKMIPLRKVAEHLGYDVQSQPAENRVLLSKGNVTMSIQRGKKKFRINDRLHSFSASPELVNMKTYVPEELFLLLVEPSV